MRILLDHNDIQDALTAYVGTMGIPNATGVKLSVHGHGVEAEVLFTPTEDTTSEEVVSVEEEDDTPPPQTKTKRTRRTKAQIEADNAAKEAANVDETVSTSADIGSEGNANDAGEEATETSSAKTEQAPKETSRKNLFGGKDDPSSEDDGKAEASPDTSPEPIVKKTRGSIFDA